MNFKKSIKNLIREIKKKELVPIYIPVDNDSLLKGKNILISGGSGGLGVAMAKQMKACGANIIIAGTNEDKLKKICDELEGISYVVLNLCKIKTMEKVINSIEKDIDILINCAGINDDTKFLDVTEDQFDNIINVNLKGTYFLSQIIAKKMIEKGIKGHILNVSSASSLRPASLPYAVSKWGITGITKGLADVLIKYGIIVNAIAPGPTATEMLGKKDDNDIYHETNPSGRYATPHEIANLATFMVSSMGDLIVGDTYYISGGAGTITLHN